MNKSCWSEGLPSLKRVKAPPNAGGSGTRDRSAPAWPTPESVVAHAQGAHDAFFPVYSATWDLIEEVLKQKRSLELSDAAALGSITASTERALGALTYCRQSVESLAGQMLRPKGKGSAEEEEQESGRSEEVLDVEEPKAPVRKGEQQLTELTCVVVMASHAADAAELFKELLRRFMQSISHTGGRPVSEADVAAVGRLHRETQRWREIVDESHYPLEVLQCELKSLRRVDVEPSTHAAPVPPPSTQQISPPPAPVPTAALVPSSPRPPSVPPQTPPRQAAQPVLAGPAPSTQPTSPPSPGQPPARFLTTTLPSPSLPPQVTFAKTWASVAKSPADGKQRSESEQGRQQQQQSTTVHDDIRGSGSGVVHAEGTQGAVGVTHKAPQPEPRAATSPSAARTVAQTEKVSTTRRKGASTEEAIATEAAMPAAVVDMVKAARPTASWTEEGQRNQGFQASKALRLQYDAFVSQQKQPQKQVSAPPNGGPCGGKGKGKQPAIPESEGREGRPEVPPTAGTPSTSFADKIGLKSQTSATSGSVLKCSSGTTGEGVKTDECHKSKSSLALSVPSASTPSPPTSSSTSSAFSPSSASASPSSPSPPSSSPSSPTSERAPAPLEHAFIHHALNLNNSNSHLTSPGRGTSDGTGDSEADSGCVERPSKKGRQRQRRKAAKEASQEQKKSELEELEAVVRAQPSFSSFNHKAHDWRSDRRRRRFLGRLLRKGQAVYLRSDNSA